MPPRSQSKKSRKALERKEKKLLEAKIRASQEKCEEGLGFLEPQGRNAQPNYTKAMMVLDAAVEIYGENASAYFLMGECLRGQELHEQAIERYTECLERDSSNTRALEGRAASYAALQKWSSVFEDYTAIIRIEPENDHAYNLRGLCTLSTRVPGLRLLSADFNHCVSDFQTAIRLNEANYYAWANLGKAYEDQGMFSDALNAYSSALKVKGDYQYAQLRRGCLALRMVESYWDDEERKQNEVENSKPVNGSGSDASSIPKSIKEVEEEVRLEIESAARRRKEEELLDSAIRDFQALMIDDTNKMKWDPCLPFNLGSCYLLRKNLNKAEEEFKLVTDIINARPQLVTDGEAEPIPNVVAIETVLNLKKDKLKKMRNERFLAGSK